MNLCLRVAAEIAKAIPLVFIFAIIGWSYYAYVVAMCIYSVPSANVAEKVVLITFYHLFFVIFAWTYLMTIFVKPAKIPDEFHLTGSEWLEIESTLGEEAALVASRRNDCLLEIVRSRRLPIYTRGANNSIRFCEACRIIKPDRAHHCSTCSRCLLKMDHHCPWVDNCVGFHNYKFFIQFLIYGSLYCFYVGGTSTKYFLNFWTEGVADVQAFRFHVLFVFFAAWMFSLSLIFLGGYHLWLTARNRTTLESFRSPVLVTGPDKLAYNLGVAENFRQVFGDRILAWLLPIRQTNLDGINWPHRVNLASTVNYSTVGSTGLPLPPRASSSQIHLLPDASRDVDYDVEANR